MIQAVIFDVDGTLVDSVDEHAEAWRRAFLDFGRDVPFAHVRSQIGKGTDQLLPIFFNDEELERFGEQLDTHRSELFKREFLPKLRPFPRVRDLFLRLREGGVKIALASSSQGDELEHYRKLCDIEGLTSSETSKDDAAQSKPHPDIFAAAWAQLGKIPSSAVAVVGDTPYDALAAAKLKLHTVGVLCGGFSRQDLEAAGCRVLMRDPADLLERYEASPENWPWGSRSSKDAVEDEGR